MGYSQEDDELDETEDASARDCAQSDPNVKLLECRDTIQPLALTMMAMSALVLRKLK